MQRRCVSTKWSERTEARLSANVGEVEVANRKQNKEHAIWRTENTRTAPQELRSVKWVVNVLPAQLALLPPAAMPPVLRNTEGALQRRRPSHEFSVGYVTARSASGFPSKHLNGALNRFWKWDAFVQFRVLRPLFQCFSPKCKKPGRCSYSYLMFILWKQINSLNLKHFSSLSGLLY